MEYAKEISHLLSQLTVEEKVLLSTGRDFWHLNGIERLGLPSIMVTDGPHGLRKQPEGADHLGLHDSVPATCFPAAAGLASSWNIDLVKQVGAALGRECRKEGVSVLLGPGVNIKRHPLGGRNFEYFSEDPYVSAMMATAWIEGLQSQQVGSSLKHYAANNHEDGRLIVDVIVDDRTLREIYLPAFEHAVKTAQPWTIMCAYNKINGVYASEHGELQCDILQDEWGYKGAMITDWGACHDRVEGIKNGQNLEMPSSHGLNTQKILQAIEQGQLSLAELDDSVARVLGLILKAKQVLNERPEFSAEQHHNLALTAAEEACVLLKNETALLPLKPNQNVAVIGAFARQTRYQGAGSSQINPTQLEQPLDKIIELVTAANGSVQYVEGYTLTGQLNIDLAEQAVTVAVKADKIILLLGLPPEDEAEGFDRQHMNLPAAQLALVEALAPFADKIAIVLQNGAPLALPFADRYPAILEAYLGGQAGASALANILFGKTNPSGKLAETFPLAVEDVPSNAWFPGQLRQSQYREGIWVGYRYFDTAQQAVAFPFGHGLSYTEFSYSQLKVLDSHEQVLAGPVKLSANDKLSLSVLVRNSGDLPGAEVVQLYVGQLNSSVHRPAKELKGFRKIFLQAGEEQTVSFELDSRAFAFWCVEQKKWLVETDSYQLCVGSSVADIRLEQTIALNTDFIPAKKNPALANYSSPAPAGFTDQAFTALLGKPIPEPVPVRPFQMNTILSETEDTWMGRLLIKMVKKQMQAMLGDEMTEQDSKMTQAFVSGITLRQILAMSEGRLSHKMMRRIIHLLNGNWLKALLAAEVHSR